MTLPSDEGGMTEKQRAAYGAYNAAIKRLHEFELKISVEHGEIKASAATALRDFNMAIIGAE